MEERLGKGKLRLAKEGRALEETTGQDRSRLVERIEQLQARRESTRVSLSECIGRCIASYAYTLHRFAKWRWVLQH